MPTKLFNSRDIKYKSRYGAMETESTAVFRLLLPCKSGTAASSARMLVLSDFEQTEKVFTFTPTDEYRGDARFWALSYTAKAPGLYWYYFEYDTIDGKTERIYRGEYATGFVGIPECRWQLTVYEDTYDRPERFKGGIMYQIFPDRFRNSGEPKIGVPDDRIIKPWGTMPEWKMDSEGKIKNNDYLGGDLKGIEEQLPYLADLGVDIIYLNPIFEAHSNHRYNTADYTRIDPLLGTEEDFVSLCDKSHELGMKIILDGVFSHTGDDSIYFNKYKRYASVGAYNSRSSLYYPWYKFSEWPDKYTSWWGIDILPEIIEGTPEYIEYITGEGGIIEKWLRLGADGWRLDVADELPDSFIQLVRERIEKVKPGAFLLGEVWEDASNKIAYSERRRYLLGRELHSVMNYPFKDAIISFLVYDDAEFFHDKILSITENYPKEVTDVLMNPLGTHDTVRILTRLCGEDCEGKDRSVQAAYKPTPSERERALRLLRVATAIQYTLPGFPSVYYGDEVGMEGCKDPFNRMGYPASPNEIDSDLLDFYKAMGRLRNSHPLLCDASFTPISGAKGCIAYSREKDGETLILVANRAAADIDYVLPVKYRGCKTLIGGGELVGLTLRLPAESFSILEHSIH